VLNYNISLWFVKKKETEKVRAHAMCPYEGDGMKESIP